MTAQTPDILIVRGQNLDLYETPLYPYPRRLPKQRRPKFIWPSTALWRGYIGTWEIRDGGLWLVDLEGYLNDGEGWREARLVDALPWLKPPVKAVWVSQTLRCPEGVRVVYRHAGFGSAFERDRWFDIEKGEVVGERLVINPPPPIEYWIEADGARRPLTHELSDGTVTSDLYAPDETPAGERFWAAEAGAIRSEAAKGDVDHVLAEYVRIPR